MNKKKMIKFKEIDGPDVIPDAEFSGDELHRLSRSEPITIDAHGTKNKSIKPQITSEYNRIKPTKQQKKNIVTDYKKVYITFFNYSKEDYIPCEFCKKQAVDIHHIDNKGMGGSVSKDFIENLVALCRECHDKCHNESLFNKIIRILHLENIIKKLKQ